MTEKAGPIGRGAAALAAFSIARPGLVLVTSLLAFLLSLAVVAERFSLDTNVANLFPKDLDWRRAEMTMDSAFPRRVARVVVVIDGATPDIADRAAAILETGLAGRTDRLRDIARPEGDLYFRRSALLFPDLPDVAAITERIIAAQPLLGTLALDPSMRGVADTLRLVAEGLVRGEGDAETFATALSAFTRVAENPTEPLDWTALFTGREADTLGRRRFLLVRPALDFMALAPGAAATEAIREEVARLDLTPANGVTVRLTGEIVMGDEEFETVFGGAIEENLLSIASVALLLWLGLRSGRLIFPLLVTLVFGLAATMALALTVVGPFNPLSIAFAVLFIGLGVDFGIQFAVAYREVRHRTGADGLRPALIGGAREAGPAIALAALALCAGFLAFWPTDYRGAAELGLVASLGMVVAVLIALTTLPAMLVFTRPKPETEPVGYPALAAPDRWLRRHATRVTIATVLVALAGAATLPWLRFDTDPVNLRDPNTEAVATYRDLQRDPEATPDIVETLAPSLPEAVALAARFAALPEVRSARTLADFVPDEQEAKLALIEDAALLLGPTLDPPVLRLAPTDEESMAALAAASDLLEEAALSPSLAPPLAETVGRLAAALARIAPAPPQIRTTLSAALLPGLDATLVTLRTALSAQPVTLASLPPDLHDAWTTSDGRSRIEVRPYATAAEPDKMDRFVAAVRAIDPNVTGPAVSVRGSAATIRSAFLTAGILATIGTLILLLIVLRSLRLSLLALAPLALAGILTLATCVLTGRPLDLANLIALPLLFAQGVAFDIYYVTAWRAGERALLPSALTRAVLYSALTNGTAFGTLALSPHPGTAGMGVLLTTSLLFALAAVLLTLPSLLTRFASEPPR